MVQGANFSPIFGKSPLSSVSPSVQKHLSSEAFRSVLAGFEIKPGDVKGITVQKGMSIKPGIQDVRLVQISQDTVQALLALGIPNAEVAIIIGADNTISELKKKLRNIRQSTLDSEEMAEVFEMLGIPFDEEGLVILDSKGGVTVVKQGLKDIEESL